MNRWKLLFIVALKNITEVTVAILGVCENTYPTRLWLHALLAVLTKQQLAHSLDYKMNIVVISYITGKKCS